MSFLDYLFNNYLKCTNTLTYNAIARLTDARVCVHLLFENFMQLITFCKICNRRVRITWSMIEPFTTIATTTCQTRKMVKKSMFV